MPISCGFSVPLMLPPFLLLSLLPHSFPLFSFSDFSSLSSHINLVESKVYKFVFCSGLSDMYHPIQILADLLTLQVILSHELFFFYDDSSLETHFHLN